MFGSKLESDLESDSAFGIDLESDLENFPRNVRETRKCCHYVDNLQPLHSLPQLIKSDCSFLH